MNGAGTVTPATLTVTAISKDGLTTSKTIAWSITPHVISAPSYYLEEGQNVWGFSQFVAIHSGTSGGNSRCEKIGKIRLCQGGPVSVTLRGPYDAQAKFLQAWHLEGKRNDPAAPQTMQIVTMSPVGDKETTTAFTLSKAWPTKIAVAGLKAGNTNIATVTVTFTAQALTRGP